MVGSVQDAEDLVQESYLRWAESDVEPDSVRNYLCTVITRLSIDHLRSARVRRESYVGPWLPEPLIADEAHDPGDLLVMSESLSTAFLLMLESLSPVERAILLLRQIFDYDYAEIAPMVDRSEANCRQLMHRARERLAEGRRRYQVDPATADSMARQFMTVCASGDLSELLGLLTDDATVLVDGGGQVSAARNPISGADPAARYLLGLASKMGADVRVRAASVGGRPAVILFAAGGRPFSVMTFAFTATGISNVYITLNPAKLQHVPSLS